MAAGYEVSFIDKKVERWIKEEAPEDGLCLKRFRADFALDHLCSFEKGAVIRIEGKNYVITKKGKRCFEECQLLQRTGKPCHLESGVAFGEKEKNI